VTRTGEAVRFHWQKGETEEFGETFFFFLLAQMAYKNILWAAALRELQFINPQKSGLNKCGRYETESVLG
jgi:hypothetical protein